ncbi:hypothetical protein [Prosthecobacter sp.]|uniref:hypothetical protein n=1 Tax=Prosthecobacter sp. TaxID=1965333 RepID=UPI0037833CAE
MKSSSESPTVLETLLSANLDVEAYDLEAFADWCKACLPSSSLVQDFKSQLQHAIDNPGLVTPKLYRAWTSDASFKTQEQLQAHLNNIWNMCFSDQRMR